MQSNDAFIPDIESIIDKTLSHLPVRKPAEIPAKTPDQFMVERLIDEVNRDKGDDSMLCFVKA